MAQAQRKTQAPAGKEQTKTPATMEQQLMALTKPAQIIDLAQKRVEGYLNSGSLVLPQDYSAGNALHMAQLTLLNTKDRNGRPALEVCDRGSVMQALLDMTFQGLNPAKKQCYFIVYGNQLAMQRSYFGDIRLAKLVDPNIEDITAAVIYKGDEVSTRIERGRRVVYEHNQDWMNSNPKDIVGAYCNIIYRDGTWTSTIMTMDQIRACWVTGHAQTNSPAHKNTPDQMVMRTVIRRACKAVINSASDATLLGQSIERVKNIALEGERAEMEQNVSARTNVVDVEFPSAAQPDQAAPQVVPPAPSAPGASIEMMDFDESSELTPTEPDFIIDEVTGEVLSDAPGSFAASPADEPAAQQTEWPMDPGF